MLDAVVRGDLAKVKQLVEADPNLVLMLTRLSDSEARIYRPISNPDREGKSGSSPNGIPILHVAAEKGHDDVVSYLLDQGAEINDRDNWGRSAIHYAATAGDVDMIRLLVKRGADPNARKNACREAPLAMVADAASAKTLIDLGADLEGRYDDGRTPLHQAVSENRQQTIEALLARNADIEALDKKNRRPLHLATWYGDPEVVELLLQNGAAVDTHSREFGTPLCHAIRGRQPEKANVVARLLTERGYAPSFGELVWLGDTDAVRAILKEDPVWARSESPIDKEPILFTAIKRGHRDITAELLDHGASPTLRGRWNESPLTAAAYAGQADVITLLLERGMDPNATGDYGEVALHWAVANGHPGRTRMFFGWGDNQEYSPRAVEVLIAAGADVNARAGQQRLDIASNVDGEIDMVQQEIDEAEIDRNPQPVQRMGPLYLAFARSDTPLHTAAQRGRPDLAAMLIKAGADVNARNARSQTPLHYAVAFQRTEIVKMLLAQNADPTAKSSAGRTALDIARELQSAELAELLGGNTEADGSGETRH